MNPIEERIARAMSELCPDETQLSASLAESIAEKCHVNGLTAAHVLEGKTPQAIAALWLRQRLTQKNITPSSTISEKAFPLLPFSQIVFNSIREGNEQAWTFPITLRTKSQNVDTEKLRLSVEKAIDAHPVFSMRIDDEGMQHYEQGYRTPYLSYTIREEEEWIYLEFVANRILGDAASLALFLRDICNAYEGRALAQDTYIEYLQWYQDHKLSAEYNQHREALHRQFDEVDCPARPDSPLKPNLGLLGVHQVEIPATTSPILTLAVAEAIMDYCDTDEAVLTWAYLGRETAEQQAIFGSLHRDIPLHFSRSEAPHQERLDIAKKKKLEQGIICSDYPYTALCTRRDLWANAVNVLVQPRAEILPSDGMLQFELVMPEGSMPAYCMLDVEMTEGDNHILIKYSSSHYTEEKISRFGGMIAEKIKEIIA